MHWPFHTTYTQLPDAFYSYLPEANFPQPAMLLFNKPLYHQLFGKEATDIADDGKTLAPFLVGNQRFANTQPFAQAYAGHQFGYFNMLGDGRAVVLGEILAINNQRFDVQLKGAGQTPYSRRGDGKATLRAMLREYLISEAMAALGIPTSRSLAVVTTGEKVYREAEHEGAVLTRIAGSHLRVGSFEYAANFTDKAALISLLQYAVNRHYPFLIDAPNLALAFLQQVIEKQAKLVAKWMSVGFIHGVLNTDNVSIAGETFDYGPCAFMNQYKLSTVYSSVDTNGRYAFGNQPSITHWNMACLAGALLSLIDEEEEKATAAAQAVLNSFPDIYAEEWYQLMAAKLGLNLPIVTAEVKQLIQDLLQWMEANEADYTYSFLVLQETVAPKPIYESVNFQEWKQRWNFLLQKNNISKKEALAIMQKQNPVYIPRNQWVEKVLDAACLANQLAPFQHFLSLLQNPFTVVDETETYILPQQADHPYYRTFCNT